MGVEFGYVGVGVHNSSRSEAYSVLNHNARTSPTLPSPTFTNLCSGENCSSGMSCPLSIADTEIVNCSMKLRRAWEYSALHWKLTSNLLSLGLYMTGHPTISKSGTVKSDTATYKKAVMHELVHGRKKIHTGYNKYLPVHSSLALWVDLYLRNVGKNHPLSWRIGYFLIVLFTFNT